MDPLSPDVAATDSADPRDRIAALTAEVEMLRAARQSAVLEAQEAASRLRNMLASFRAVFRRTLEAAETLEDVSLHLTGRFDALARYGVGTLMGRSVELEDIVRDELLSVGESGGPRATVAGPPVDLTFRQASLMGLAVHELVTNSIKFGALAVNGGALSVSWTLSGTNEDVLRFFWTEAGVSVLSSAPMREGFGRRFIEGGLPYQLNARTSFELRPGGIRCEIVLPEVKAGSMMDMSGDHID